MGNAHQYGQRAYSVPAEQISGIEPPTALHAAHAGLGRYEEGKAPAGLQSTAQWLAEARGVWESVNQVRQVADPELTQDGHVLKVHQVAERGIERICKGYDRARQAQEAARLAEGQPTAWDL
jgi:hypothetical protein